ncbi:MAG: hypothetical protein EZS28_020663 [Streblomastix strix]|uniref:Uncharacterized protein n=1 Tax=Streblomastix strix TaxID=222440 RepID=A0A5J4VMG0_9EUKA|nr:MAG: hypothetical protein EZS28_020663 [Streblomastix strix]
MIERIIHASLIILKDQSNEITRNIIDKDGTLDKLIIVLKNDDFRDQEINSKAALAIGQAFLGQPIPVEYRSEVIQLMKKISSNEELYVSSEGIRVIAGLTKCKINIPEILSNNYYSDIMKFLTQKYDLIVDYALQLVLNILINGQQETIEIARAILPINRISELTEHKDQIISMNSRAIINLLGN